MRRVAGRSWARLGWDPHPGESQRTGITRGRVLSVLGLTGHEASVGEEAVARFRAFVTDKTRLAPDLLTPVAHVVAAWGGEEGWTTILDQYRSSTTPQDKVRYLTALPATRDPSLLARTLDLALGDEVRTQDGCFLIAEVMANRAGGALAWEWFERHWDEIHDRYPPALIGRILEGIAMLVDPAVATAVHAFADSHDLPLAGPRLDQLLERMDINVALAARLQGTMAAALSPLNRSSGGHRRCVRGGGSGRAAGLVRPALARHGRRGRGPAGRGRQPAAGVVPEQRPAPARPDGARRARGR